MMMRFFTICWFLHDTSIKTNRPTKIAYYIVILCSIFCVVLTETAYDLVLSKEGFKMLIIRQITEHGHLTLMCPKIENESSIEWFKDGNLLNTSFRNNMGYGEEEPHLTVDAYNSLYILHATKREEGTYTCVVDGEHVQKYYVEIVSKSRLLNEGRMMLIRNTYLYEYTTHRDFIRFSIYLGFVLSLTLTCYCAGICLAWHRRASFADPLNLYTTNRLGN